MRITGDQKKIWSYWDPVFDENKVYEVFNEILTNPVYAHNIKKLQSLQQASGGRKLAVEFIEKVHIVGKDHLIDREMVQKYNSISCPQQYLCWITIIGIFAFMILTTVRYFM